MLVETSTPRPAPLQAAGVQRRSHGDAAALLSEPDRYGSRPPPARGRESAPVARGRLLGLSEATVNFLGVCHHFLSAVSDHLHSRNER